MNLLGSYAQHKQTAMHTSAMITHICQCVQLYSAACPVALTHPPPKQTPTDSRARSLLETSCSCLPPVNPATSDTPARHLTSGIRASRFPPIICLMVDSEPLQLSQAMHSKVSMQELACRVRMHAVRCA